MKRLALVMLLGLGLSACLHLPARNSPKVGDTETTAAAGADESISRVFVFTARPADKRAMPEQSRREKATNDVVRRMGTKKGIELVGAREVADVVVEVLSAVNLFKPEEGEFNPNALYADVTIDGSTMRLDASGTTSKKAAFRLADLVDKWIEGHRAEVIEARTKKK